MVIGETSPEGTSERVEEVLTLPEHTGPVGPITARVQRRWVLGYLGVWSASVAAILLSGSPTLRAVASGLAVPGGGFLYTSDPPLFLLTAVALLLGFVAWLLVGMMLAPFAVWLVAALLATTRTSTGLWSRALPAVVATGPVLLATTAMLRRVELRRARRRAEDANARLVSSPYRPTVAPSPPGHDELGRDELDFLRSFLDRALQPVESFDGFEWVDQFQVGAVRYQLNYAQWSLALAQSRCAPAFQGYLAEAQRRLVEKMLDPRVWRYWRWENLWGNLDRNPDPIRRDNVMFSGYLSVMLGTYATLTGDRRYDQPGSLAFRWDERRTFAYDAGSVAEALRDNFERSRFCLFSCEPNWVYSICNAIGMAGLVAHDRTHGTTHADELRERFRRSFELEFLRADGRLVTNRSSRMGISVPGIGRSTANEAAIVLWLSAVLPDVANRSWCLLREDLAGGEDGSGGPVFRSPLDRMDVGSYRLSYGPMTYAFAMAAAREMGDTETFERLARSLERVAVPRTRDGVTSYPGSVMSNLMFGLARFGGARAWHDVVARGLPEERHRWPVLADAPYPDVLVARATSDGAALDLVLHPGSGPRRVTLGLARLVPGRCYTVWGAGVAGRGEVALVGDGEGRAGLEVDLDGRVEVRVAP